MTGDSSASFGASRSPAAGTPTTFYPLGGPVTDHEGQGAVFAGVYWRRRNIGYADERGQYVDIARKSWAERGAEYGIRLDYRANPHGVSGSFSGRDDVGERRRIMLLVNMFPATSAFRALRKAGLQGRR